MARKLRYELHLYNNETKKLEGEIAGEATNHHGEAMLRAFAIAEERNYWIAVYDRKEPAKTTAYPPKTIVDDTAEAIEDERNVYLAYFDAMGIDVAEATRIGRNHLYEMIGAPCPVCGHSCTREGVTWTDTSGRCVDCAPLDDN